MNKTHPIEKKRVLFYSGKQLGSQASASLKITRGFTLLEIMVALAILSISLVVLLGLRNKDIALSVHARDLTEATLLARQKMTEITISGFPQLGEQKGHFGYFAEEDPKFHWRQEVRLTPFTAVRELVLQIFWKQGHREQSIEFTTYLFQQ